MILTKYDYYKDSEIEWLGSIPSHWSVRIFKQISYMKGRIGWQGLKYSEFSDDIRLPYLITGMNFKGGKIRWEEVYHISIDRYNEAPEIQLKVGDVLLTKDGTIGKLLLVDSLPGKASLNSHLLLLRAHKNAYLPSYLYYQLDSNNFSGHIEYNKYGTTFYGLTQEAMGRFKIILPPIQEQFQIAKYLDQKTTIIDTKISLLERKILNYKDLRICLINESVCRGLNKGVNLKDSGVAWIGQIPDHWEVKRGKNIFIERSIKGHPEEPLLAASQKKGVVLKSMLSQRSMEAQKDFHNFKLVKIDDFVISLRSFEGGIETAYYRGIISPVYTVFCPQGKLSTSFFKHLFKSDIFINYLQSRITGIRDGQSIKFVEIQNTFFPIPTLKEQEIIANYLDEKIQKIDSILININFQIKRLKELRKTLINDVVTGKFKVTE